MAPCMTDDFLWPHWGSGSGEAPYPDQFGAWKQWEVLRGERMSLEFFGRLYFWYFVFKQGHQIISKFIGLREGNEINEPLDNLFDFFWFDRKVGRKESLALIYSPWLPADGLELTALTSWKFTKIHPHFDLENTFKIPHHFLHRNIPKRQPTNTKNTQKLPNGFRILKWRPAHFQPFFWIQVITDNPNVERLL